MPRMRRGKGKGKEGGLVNAPADWQAPHLHGQCIWCGKLLGGPDEGALLDTLHGDRYTSSYCPECRTEAEDAQHRELERRRAARAGIPEEHWPPLLPSRLEQRTGSRFGTAAVPSSEGEP